MVDDTEHSIDQEAVEHLHYGPLIAIAAGILVKLIGNTTKHGRDRMNKPKVGDKLFLVDAGNRARTYSKQRYGEVTKVGRKYFTVTYGEKPYETEVEFYLDTRRQRTEYSHGYTLYESEQEWADEIEKERLAQEISNVFRYTGYRSLTLAQLREVAKVIGIQLERNQP